MFSKINKRLRLAIPNRQVDQQQFEELREVISAHTKSIYESTLYLQDKVNSIENRLVQVQQASKIIFDHTFELRRQLLEIRKTDEYKELFEEKNPLVTVRIATWNNSELLVERAIKSVFEQTYKNWEIIVVGDGCDDDTESRISELNDDRITFYNFPYRNQYPEDPIKRWQVAGSPGMNKGAELASGKWIAPLDDDDEFTPDHIQVLLEKALSNKYEMVYGDINRVRIDEGVTDVLSAYPPQFGEISSQSFIYPKLLSFFEWEMQSWAIDEPGDWNLIRRMMDSGVLIGKVDKVVSTIYSAAPGSK